MRCAFSHQSGFCLIAVLLLPFVCAGCAAVGASTTEATDTSAYQAMARQSTAQLAHSPEAAAPGAPRSAQPENTMNPAFAGGPRSSAPSEQAVWQAPQTVPVMFAGYAGPTAYDELPGTSLSTVAGLGSRRGSTASTRTTPKASCGSG
jgi:hypothetical protein